MFVINQRANQRTALASSFLVIALPVLRETSIERHTADSSSLFSSSISFFLFLLLSRRSWEWLFQAGFVYFFFSFCVFFFLFLNVHPILRSSNCKRKYSRNETTQAWQYSFSLSVRKESPLFELGFVSVARWRTHRTGVDRVGVAFARVSWKRDPKVVSRRVRRARSRTFERTRARAFVKGGLP